MELPPNALKACLGDGGPVQWGMFTSLADPVAAEICAGAGFDFVIVDTEHAPADLRTVLHQLQALGAYPLEPVVRAWNDDRALLKRLLDVGARTLLVPMVDSAEQAAAVVAATRYVGGVRGVSSARAARWGRIPDYHATADSEICVIVQVETRQAIAAVDEIAAVPGIDAVFVGPMDLATSLGYPGGGTHPEVVEVVANTIERIVAAGCAAGVLAATPEVRHRYVGAGATFVAVGVDTMLLSRATSALRAELA